MNASKKSLHALQLRYNPDESNPNETSIGRNRSNLVAWRSTNASAPCAADPALPDAGLRLIRERVAVTLRLHDSLAALAGVASPLLTVGQLAAYSGR